MEFCWEVIASVDGEAAGCGAVFECAVWVECVFEVGAVDAWVDTYGVGGVAAYFVVDFVFWDVVWVLAVEVGPHLVPDDVVAVGVEEESSGVVLGDAPLSSEGGFLFEPFSVYSTVAVF